MKFNVIKMKLPGTEFPVKAIIISIASDQTSPNNWEKPSIKKYLSIYEMRVSIRTKKNNNKIKFSP